MRFPDNEAVVPAMWADSDRAGLPGVAAVRGRLRLRRGGKVDDSRIDWVHRVRDGKIRWTGSSPDLGGLPSEAVLPGRAITDEAFMAMHSGPPLP